MSNLIKNSIRTPDGTVLRSRGVHDFASHFDEVSNETYFTDGGLDYIRRSVNTVPAVELDVYDDSPHDLIRQEFDWGSYGKYGDQPLRYIRLCDMEEDHINAILRTQPINDKTRKLFQTELNYRENLKFIVYNSDTMKQMAS